MRPRLGGKMVKEPFFSSDENEVYGQWKWKEICYDPHDLNGFVAPDSNVVHCEQAAIIKEARDRARQELFDRLLELAEENFTEHQKQVFYLMRKNKTYQEIAAILQENYSSARSGYTSIAYAIKGIRSKMHNKHHGGIERKLQKLCSRDKKCREILVDLKMLEQESVDVAIGYLKRFDQWYVEYDEIRDKDVL